ncbi:hypothetical protein KOR42_29830 [Thalassoglobus neptunius]|uniref:DUF420 domain-containing protein n=2 Tax=Thalassoglobus neptunius TaxID=1938619 RepID=A0A5C5WNW7_9PLAN|nr:hypothetical protein KOR42_29830 [Thalassoglobus neptunius]
MNRLYTACIMKNGFLGHDASFMLDFVVTALVAIVPVLLYSLYVVKYQKKFRLHRNLQIALGLTLLVAVTAFEVDTQIIHGGWENIVNKDPDSPRLSGEAYQYARSVLHFHLIFAISTPFLWATTLFLALKKFPGDPKPGSHSRLHKVLGWASVIDIVMTSVTGLWFYYVAFVA